MIKFFGHMYLKFILNYGACKTPYVHSTHVPSWNLDNHYELKVFFVCNMNVRNYLIGIWDQEICFGFEHDCKKI
jgi:hypothetical protein